MRDFDSGKISSKSEPIPLVHFGVLGVDVGVILEAWGVIGATSGTTGTSFGRSRSSPGARWGKSRQKVRPWTPRGSPSGTIFSTFSVFFASLFGVVFEGAFGGARELIFNGFGDDF